MVIRPKYFLLFQTIGFVFVFLGMLWQFARHDSFPALLDLAAGLFILAIWETSFISLRNGVLTKRVLLIPTTSFPVGDIRSVEPHKQNQKWGNGTVVNVWSATRRKITVNLNKPAPFLALLREQAPQAEFLL